MYEPGLSIRKLAENDVASAAKLVARFYRFNEEFDPAYSTVDKLEEAALNYVEQALGDPSSLILGAYWDGKLVGIAHVKITSNPLLKNGRLGLLKELYVLPRYRRRGIASKLINDAKTTLEEAGVSILAAEFPALNDVALSFYRKHGFRPLTSIFIQEV